MSLVRGLPLSTDNQAFQYEDGMAIVIDWKPEEAHNLHRELENFSMHPSLKESESDELQVNLETCIDLFTEEENLTALNHWHCSTCNQHVPSKKKLSLKSLPPILILHLKRFQYTTIYRDKITSLVNFPLTDFDLSKFLADSSKPYIYDLYAVSNHFGGMSGGHYTAYALNHKDKAWYKLDDSHCVPVTDPNYIISPNAYLLFYKLRDDQTYEIPESIQLDDDEDSPKTAPPATAPIDLGTAAEDQKPQTKENSKYLPQHYEPTIIPDEGPYASESFSEFPPYAPSPRKQLARSLYVCHLCSEELPGLEELQVHFLTAHWETDLDIGLNS